MVLGGNPRRMRFLYGVQFGFVILGKRPLIVLFLTFSPVLRRCRSSASRLCWRTEDGNVLSLLKPGSSSAYRTVDSFLSFRCTFPIWKRD
jgi:hypothetical protein